MPGLQPNMEQMTLVVAAEAVTPSDDEPMEVRAISKGLFVGGAGNVAVILEGNNSSVIFLDVQGFLPLKAQRVLATGTTATNMLFLY